MEAPRERKFLLSDARISRALHSFKELLIHPFAELTLWFPEKMIIPQKGLLNPPKICLNFCGIKGPELSAVAISQSPGKALQRPTECLGVWSTAEPKCTAFLVMDRVLKYRH